MDPLTVMGIACNVMQIISFGHEVFSLARRISKDGSPDASLADKSARLSDLSGELQSSLNMQQQTRPLNQTQLRLHNVAKKCLSSSNNLTEELDQIKWKTESKGSNSKTQRRLLSQTWKSLWRKSKIDKLQEEMTNIEQTMQTTILTDMWYDAISSKIARVRYVSHGLSIIENALNCIHITDHGSSAHYESLNLT
jgi:hypothetical protein